MADSKITALDNLTSADPANDMIPIVDVSATPPASGNTKRISINNLLACSPSATLASATITGALTVDTTTLVVNPAGYPDRVGIGTASPAVTLDVVGAARFVAAAAGPKLSIENAGGSTRFKSTDTSSFYYSAYDHSFTNTDGSINRYTIDNNGVSTWYVSGSTAMTLNATGLGVGTSPSYKIHALSTSPDVARFERSGAGGAARIQLVNGSGTVWYFRNSVNDLVFNYEGTDLVTFGSSGNVGIGVTPSAWLSGYKALQINATTNLFGTGTASWLTNNWTVNAAGSNTYQLGSATAATAYFQGSGSHYWFNAVAGTGTISAPVQAMTLDASGSSGRLQVGNGTTTVSSVGSVGVSIEGSASNYGRVLVAKTVSGARDSLANYHNGSYIGGVVYSDTATSFPTSSDYRLKEDVQPLVGGLSRVNALKPSTYKWKLNGSNAEGFIAHELAEVVPDAVMGEKDAVNEDGSIKPQAVDLSKVVPVLVAAIQELTARVQTLETR